MQGNKKVKVRSTVNASVSIDVPAINMRRVWPRKGFTLTLSYDQLEQAVYEPGVDYLFQNGILYIDDMEVKKALGLEPEDATKDSPTIKVLSEAEMKKAIGDEASLEELKNLLKTLPREQKIDLANFAADNSINSMDKAELLKKESGVDVIKKATWKKEDEEEKKKASKE